MNKYNDGIDFKIINDAEQLALFKELDFKIQKKIISAGIRKAAKPIIETAKANFNSTKKNKSTTGYADLNSSFKIQENNKNTSAINYFIGVKYNDTKGKKNWYKYRFIEWGTEERQYKVSKRSLFNEKKGTLKHTGKMTGTHFFYDAVEARKDKVQEDISKEVTAQFEKVVAKYN